MRKSFNNAVVAMVRDGKILMVRQVGRDIFVLPGGGIEEGETPVQAASREIKEEVGSEVKERDLELVGRFEGHLTKDADRAPITIHCYLAHAWEGEPRDMSDTDEVEELRWCSVSELGSMKTSEMFHTQVLPALMKDGHFS